MNTQVPGPRPLPGIGTLYAINPAKVVESAQKLAHQYGGIYVHHLPNKPPLYVITSFELANELADESRFQKEIHDSLAEIRAFAGNGLFTAEQDDPEWERAHRILMPAFTPVALKGMYDGMADIVDQLMYKWSRVRSDARVDLPSDFTRLTLDTIALTSFSYRFNSFYSEQLHPFIGAMADGLDESGKRAHLPDFAKKMNVLADRRFHNDVSVMEELVDFLIAERKQNPSPEGEQDVLDLMLSAKDPSSGKGLSDRNLRYQLITFLIAGHETTSGLLSFTLYELLKNPDVMTKAREVVDNVLDGRFPEYDDIKDLGYLDQILRETLRKYPPAPGYAVTPLESTVLGKGSRVLPEGVRVEPGDVLFIELSLLHRDPSIWAEPEKFDPDRFGSDRAKEIPHNAWKPFGNGQRSCIGRFFALQEATLALAVALQHFEFEFEDPNYQLHFVDGLTRKPKDLFIHIKPRVDYPYLGRTGAKSNGQDEETGSRKLGQNFKQREPNGYGLTVLYGSNAGTSKNFARQLATFGQAQGFNVAFKELNEVVGQKFPADQPVLICTASYEGLPTDNARKFVNWLTSTVDADLSGVKYAVLGVGNSEWANTFQRIPTLIDEQLEALGAERILDRGVADVRSDYAGAFEDWSQELWDRISALTGVDLDAGEIGDQVSVSMISRDRNTVLRDEPENGFVNAVIEENQVLSTEADGPINHKRKIAIRLPEGTEYKTGDYLEFVPRNPAEQVERVLSKFDLSADQQVRLAGRSSFLPLDVPVTVSELIGGYVELNTPASVRQVRELASECVCPPEKARLEELADDTNYQREIQGKRRSVLDLLTEFKSVDTTFEAFLGMLQPMKPRKYSISSSALRDPRLAELTISQIDAPAWSGSGRYRGVATTWLANKPVGSRVSVSVTPGNAHFRPEKSIERPMIMVAAGTGIAPMRAFLEENVIRAKNSDDQLSRSLFFYGCHGASSDYLYKEELANWEETGVVDVREAYSRHPETMGTENLEIKHVQDRLWVDRADVIELLEQGARIYVCGDAEHLAPAVRTTITKIIADKDGSDLTSAQEKVESMEREDFTYVCDVFS